MSLVPNSTYSDPATNLWAFAGAGGGSNFTAATISSLTVSSINGATPSGSSVPANLVVSTLTTASDGTVNTYILSANSVNGFQVNGAFATFSTATLSSIKGTSLTVNAATVSTLMNAGSLVISTPAAYPLGGLSNGVIRFEPGNTGRKYFIDSQSISTLQVYDGITVGVASTINNVVSATWTDGNARYAGAFGTGILILGGSNSTWGGLDQFANLSGTTAGGINADAINLTFTQPAYVSTAQVKPSSISGPVKFDNGAGASITMAQLLSSVSGGAL
jgi:hypothetical protein